MVPPALHLGVAEEDDGVAWLGATDVSPPRPVQPGECFAHRARLLFGDAGTFRITARLCAPVPPAHAPPLPQAVRSLPGCALPPELSAGRPSEDCRDVAEAAPVEGSLAEASMYHVCC